MLRVARSAGPLPLVAAARLLIGMAVAGLTPAALAAAQTTPTAIELATRIQAHYDGVRDFTADFSLRQSSSLLSGTAEEHGTVEIKKPGRFRFAWETGDKKLFVSDGTRVYSYFPKDKYVTISALSTGSASGFPFLTGNGNLARDFVSALAADQPANEWHLDVQPKASGADYSRLTIEVDRRSLQLRGLVIVGKDGQTSVYRFSNMRENVDLPDSAFAFTPPKNVEIRQ